ncbi:hypothetical protein SAMN05880501_11338 [Ureibacillus xyleni]|uniref:Uncharacterized protein n=1 Tax=Ureibacillus xyleni TaxID=614648 RepID=A0A285TLP9_9BACL|nr:hypothetical protein [Ureibacillus xyleni]SOC21656.1 hypothetical protein SAMN05880501_11338 [Ureibacillus xyleni]
MAITAKIFSLATIFFSIVAGLLLFYWMNPSSKEQKRKQLEEVTDFFINFVIFMWIGKVLLNLSIFVKDPLAILAYPVDSTSFYVAIIGSILRLIYKQRKNKLPIISLLIPIILTASFMFEFIQFVQDQNVYSLTNLIFYGILVTIFYYLKEKLSTVTLYSILLISWLVGTLLMFFTQPFVSVFGYLLSWPFILLFFLFMTIVLISIKLKR